MLRCLVIIMAGISYANVDKSSAVLVCQDSTVAWYSGLGTQDLVLRTWYSGLGIQGLIWDLLKKKDPLIEALKQSTYLV